MPKRFLKSDHRETLSNFPATVDEHDVIIHFLLTPTDLALVNLNRTNTQRLGFAILLCALRYLGFFPTDVMSIPENALAYLVQQLACVPGDLLTYGKRPKTRREHQNIIRDYLGFRPFKTEEYQKLLEWLSDRALENDRPSTLLQQASEWLYKQRIVRPGITTLEELILVSRDHAHQLTYDHVAEILDLDLENRLNQLLNPNLEIGNTPLTWLRLAARGYSAKDINQVLDKIDMLYQWSIDEQQLTKLPPGRILHLLQIARRSSNQALQRKSERERYPLLIAFVADARERLTDEILDLYDQRLVQTERDARQDLQAHRLKISDALQKVAWYFGSCQL